jgi:Lipocalin-like domain
MKPLSISAVLVAASALALPASAEDIATQIVGVWKLKSFENVEVETSKAVKTYGDNPLSTYIFTKGGHFAVVIGTNDRKRPATGVLTDEDRVHLHSTMAANVGTYKVDGSKVSFTYTLASNGLWTGTTRVNEVSIAGNVMTQKSPVAKGISTGKMMQFTAVLEKVE